MCAYAVMTTAYARKIGRTETNLMFRLSARESVGIFVLLSWSMFYNHVVLGQFLKHLASCPCGSLKFSNHVRLLWSVRTTNLRPNK